MSISEMHYINQHCDCSFSMHVKQNITFKLQKEREREGGSMPLRQYHAGKGGLREEEQKEGEEDREEKEGGGE